ncbi:MAG TPA: peptide chain release factor N(5)-glutamine methyltransferase [Acidimicrobiales bacterium]|jgi:release factor glutamine methyltransferase
MTRGELLSELAAQLGAPHEARWIVEEVAPSASSSTRISEAQVTAAQRLADRRAAGEPLQYVLGHWAFRTLDLLVDPRVLIPRPETEQVVEAALAEAATSGDALTVVDAGTGSGAIALSMAVELTRRGISGAVYATDTSADALDVARANGERVGSVEPALLPVSWFEGTWLDALPDQLRGAVDLVVSNPPYVAEVEWAGLDPEVRLEPRGALVAGAGSEGTAGLADVEAVLSQALRWLGRPGTVVIEMAPHQVEAARRLAVSLGYVDVAVRADLSGRDRTLIGHLR